MTDILAVWTHKGKILEEKKILLVSETKIPLGFCYIHLFILGRGGMLMPQCAYGDHRTICKSHSLLQPFGFQEANSGREPW